MATFQATAGNDVVLGPGVAGPNDCIDAAAGDDTITLGPDQTFVSGPGNDTIIGSNYRSQYGLWFAVERPYVDLAPCYAFDGFGGQDQLSGTGTVHMRGLGGKMPRISKNKEQ